MCRPARWRALSSGIALLASLAELISTKPKPRERPLSRSFTTVADSTVPADANSDSRSAPVVEKARFPTNSFLPMTFSCPAGAIGFASQLSEREAQVALEGRRGGTHKQKDAILIRQSGDVRNSQSL